MSLVWVWTVTQNDRADRAITKAITSLQGVWTPAHPAPGSLSRSQIQKWIDERRVTLNSKPLKSNTPLKSGDRIEIHVPETKSLEITPEDRPLDILFEDSDLVVINKPQGLTVHPSTTQREGTLVHALLHHIKDLSGIGGVYRPGIVHRIDKDTSGVLVVSKSDRAHLKLVEIFSRHEIDRQYWALVYGVPKIPARQNELKIESLIARNPNDRKKMSMKVTRGRKAISRVSVIESYSTKNSAFASWVSVGIETGRTHQIRVHLTGIGNSVLGDPVYGVPTTKHSKFAALPTKEVRPLVEQLPGQALHARSLGFKHPVSGQPLHFEAEPPQAFKNLLAALQKFR